MVGTPAQIISDQKSSTFLKASMNAEVRFCYPQTTLKIFKFCAIDCLDLYINKIFAADLLKDFLIKEKYGHELCISDF